MKKKRINLRPEKEGRKEEGRGKKVLVGVLGELSSIVGMRAKRKGVVEKETRDQRERERWG